MERELAVSKAGKLVQACVFGVDRVAPGEGVSAGAEVQRAVPMMYWGSIVIQWTLL